MQPVRSSRRRHRKWPSKSRTAAAAGPPTGKNANLEVTHGRNHGDRHGYVVSAQNIGVTKDIDLIVAKNIGDLNVTNVHNNKTSRSLE